MVLASPLGGEVPETRSKIKRYEVTEIAKVRFLQS